MESSINELSHILEQLQIHTFANNKLWHLCYIKHKRYNIYDNLIMDPVCVWKLGS